MYVTEVCDWDEVWTFSNADVAGGIEGAETGGEGGEGMGTVGRGSGSIAIRVHQYIISNAYVQSVPESSPSGIHQRYVAGMRSINMLRFGM